MWPFNSDDKLLALIDKLNKENNDLEVRLINKIADLSKTNKEVAELGTQLSAANLHIEQLQTLIKELESNDTKKVTYAQARKSMTKAQIKKMRKAVEDAPNRCGFGGSVTVYNKKTKKVTQHTFSSKSDALEILKKAENGDVEIVI